MPSRREELLSLAREARDKGDHETADRALRAVDEIDRGGQSEGKSEEKGVARRVAESVAGTAKLAGKMINPTFRDPRQVAGMGDAGASMVSAMGTEVGAGLAGLGTVAANVTDPRAMERGADVVQSVRGTAYQPRTDLGRQYVGNVGRALGPLAHGLQAASEFTGDAAERGARRLGASDELASAAGSFGYTAPTAALTLASVPRPKPANTPGFLYDASGLPTQRFRVQPRVGDGRDVTPPPQTADEVAAATKQLIKDSQRRKGEPRVAAQVDPDPDIVAAAQRLDIELSPGATSRNPVYMDLEQSLKARPNSGILAKEARAIQQIQDRADDLITQLGGSPDRVVFTNQLRANIDSTMQNLQGRAGRLYGRVEKMVPRRATTDAANSRAYLASQIDDLGGNKALLTPLEKKLSGLLNSDDITYAALERVRRDIGSAYNKRGPYADVDSQILDRVYAALSQDQMAVAAQHGAEGMLQRANSLTSQYKGLQKNAVRLYGKELAGTGRDKVQNAANGLIKGDPKHFRQLMRYVPESAKQDAAVAVLNDIFVSGTRSGSAVGGGFATAFRALTRNKTALNELLDVLPPHARQRFMDIGRVSDGLYRAAKYSNSSTAKTLLANAENPSGLAKLYGAKGQIAAAESITTAVGLPGVGAASAIITEVLKTSKSAGQKADALLSSPAMQEAIKQTALGNTRMANSVMARSPQFRAWIATQEPQVAAEIARVGFISWLVSEQEEQ